MVAASPQYKSGNARRSLDRRFSSYRQPSPRGEGAPKGRIGHWRYESEWENASQVDDLRKHPSAANAVPLPRWGRLRGATLRVNFYKGRCPKVVSSHQPLKTPHSCFQTTGFNGFKRFRWRLRRILDDGILVSSAFPSRGRCPEGADRAPAVCKRVGKCVSSRRFTKAPYPPLTRSPFP